MDIMGYHIGGSVLICCAMPFLLFLFYLATVFEGHRVKDAFQEDEVEEAEDADGMWIITEE